MARLKARVAALRKAAGGRGTRLRPVLDAALAELGGAVDTLAGAVETMSSPGDRSGRSGPADSAPQAERRLLQAVFQQVPVPLFLLGHDGIVRRANSAAGRLVGSGPGYPTGKPFTAFVDLPFRSAMSAELDAVIRSGHIRSMRCALLTSDGVSERDVTACPVQVRGDAGLVAVAVARPAPAASAAAPGQVSAAEPEARSAASADEALRDSIRRLDMVISATRVLLESGVQGESVALQRFARLLARELRAWLILDLERYQRLRRQLVAGPDDSQRSEQLARIVAGADPEPGSAPLKVHESGSSLVIAHAEDPGVLGDDPDGVPLLVQLGASSVLSVPVPDAERAYGVLTLVRGDGPFSMAEVGLVEELAEHLALAIRMNRTLRYRAEVAEALQVSLLPRQARQIPGTDVAIAHIPATTPSEAGGDFCDVYPAEGGWGFCIGDACGRGQDVAALTAAARHSIRVLAHWRRDPAAVLRGANEILLQGEEEPGGRFVTASVGYLQWEENALRVVLGSAGHPWPVLVRPDGKTQAVQGGGLPLGIFPDADPVTRTVRLKTGDLLFAFSDGISSASGPALEYFDDRLNDELASLAGQPADRVVSRVREVLLEFCGGQLRDDVTMLAVRAGEPPDGWPSSSSASRSRR